MNANLRNMSALIDVNECFWFVTKQLKQDLYQQHQKNKKEIAHQAVIIVHTKQTKIELTQFLYTSIFFSSTFYIYQIH